MFSEAKVMEEETLNREELLLFEEMCISGQCHRPGPAWAIAERYSEVASDDLTDLLGHLFKNSRPADIAYPNDRLALCADPSLEFRAFVEPWKAQEAEGGQITISTGVLLAMDDLFYRLGATQSFFNSRPFSNEEELWSGGECLWPSRGGYGDDSRSIPSPPIRYFDYSIAQIHDQEIQHALDDKCASYLSLFYSGIPTAEHRRLLAHNMVGIAMKWLLLHEESHFAEGHLGVFDRVGTGIQIDADSVSKRKAMEWQADRSATEGSFDLIWSNFDSLEYQTFPRSLRDDEKIEFCLRFLLSSVGTVMLLFRYVEVMLGASNLYPSAHTRLTGLYFAVAKSVQQRNPASYNVTQHDLVRAIAGSLDDMCSVSRVLGFEVNSGLASIPTHAIQNWQSHSEFGLFDEEQEASYLCSKLWAELGVRSELLPYEGTTPKGELANKYDEKWFGELGQIVASFNSAYSHQFSQLRPFQF